MIASPTVVTVVNADHIKCHFRSHYCDKGILLLISDNELMFYGNTFVKFTLMLTCASSQMFP